MEIFSLRHRVWPDLEQRIKDPLNTFAGQGFIAGQIGLLLKPFFPDLDWSRIFQMLMFHPFLGLLPSSLCFSSLFLSDNGALSNREPLFILEKRKKKMWIALSRLAETLCLESPQKEHIISLLWRLEFGHGREERLARQIILLASFYRAGRFYERLGKKAVDAKKWGRFVKERIEDKHCLSLEKEIENFYFSKNRAILSFLGKKPKSISFLEKTETLLYTPRKGLVVIGAESPLSVADHVYFLSCLGAIVKNTFNKDIKLDDLISILLSHDLPEIETGDLLPYSSSIEKAPLEVKKREFNTWPSRSPHSRDKTIREFNSLKKILKGLEDKRRKTILKYWIEYTKGLTREGRLARQLNRIQVFLEALEHSSLTGERPYLSWFLGTQLIVDDPHLVSLYSSLSEEFFNAFRSKEISF